MQTRIACVQANVVFSDPEANACRAIEELTRLKAEGVDLAIFPEAFLTGYCFASREEAERAALDVDWDSGSLVTNGPPCVDRIRATCSSLGINAVIGFAGRHVRRSMDQDGRSAIDTYNGALLFLRSGKAHLYRKCHLPELGLDRFVSQSGADLPVFQTDFGKLGILICFDMRMPEAARVLSLAGAELIALPTNWPEGAEVSAEHICIARASENRVYFATCNRVGEENGFRFIGRSKIIAPSGKVIASAGRGEETLIADLELSEARQKRSVVIPGLYETEAFAARRPELYGPITNN